MKKIGMGADFILSALDHSWDDFWPSSVVLTRRNMDPTDLAFS